MSAHVVVLRHSDADGPGAIGRELEARGIALREVRAYDGASLPSSAGDARALLVMGGPMSADDDSAHPFLTDEKRLIAAASGAGVPVLGVCLGAQLVACALGGGVVRAPAPEIGWLDVERVTNDALFDLLPMRFTPFQWHGDAIVLPPGATLLARSTVTDVQAFRARESVYAIQFHLESDAAMITNMARDFEGELHEQAIDTRALLAATSTHIAEQERLAARLFGAWADAIAKRA